MKTGGLTPKVWIQSLMAITEQGAFPIPSKVALKLPAEGRDPGGDAVIVI